jgi:hypothetical protein
MPVNYIVGPGDELQITVYGVQEFSASSPVSVEVKSVFKCRRDFGFRNEDRSSHSKKKVL